MKGNQPKIRRSLLSIQALLEDETTDDLTKWRNFCYSQLTQLKFHKFTKNHEISEINKESHKLQQTFEEISKIEQEIIKSKHQIMEAIQNAKQQEEEIRKKIEQAHQSYEKQTNISLILQSAPNFLKTRMQVHKVKFIEIIKKFDSINSLLNSLNLKISTLNTKLQQLTKAISQNKNKYYRFQEENQTLQKQTKSIVIPDFSQEIQSLSLKFKNSTEASKTLFAVDDKIAYYESELGKTTKLDYKPSDCAALETLIEQEKKKQKDIMDSIVNQYNTDSLKQEIFEAKQQILKLSTQVSEAEQDSSLKMTEIRVKFDKQEDYYQNQIQENENKINKLRKKLAELSKKLPVYSNETKETRQTQTAFPLPTYF
ncbi:hypothetical protein TRFO_08889 [Tritrichomonas foetus]|uniref:Uncharacterized protein n=1 Tax=Tritrichomonas foetus TaxID=1144522 RepID=A0A1J4JM25_9EUKA|nr:hypothetical protein TRFO_08889 [Tritrichomonas foetus]|eukprot:OHS98324.1 hypothetical protein TRFO_08889 [Tritrichomonas foetus]